MEGLWGRTVERLGDTEVGQGVENSDAGGDTVQDTAEDTVAAEQRTDTGGQGWTGDTAGGLG